MSMKFCYIFKVCYSSTCLCSDIFWHSLHNTQVMAIVADFMLVWLPAPTVSLKPSLGISAGPLSKFFYGCPDNAFQVMMFGCWSWIKYVIYVELSCVVGSADVLLLQVALAGTSYSFLQRIGAIVVSIDFASPICWKFF